LIFREKSLEQILMINGTIDDPNFEKRSSKKAAYIFSLCCEEVLFLHSDGLIGNIAKSFYYNHGQNRDEEYCYNLIIEMIRKHQTKYVSEIRDHLITNYQHLFLPSSLRRDDDVTFAVVKKTS